MTSDTTVVTDFYSLFFDDCNVGGTDCQEKSANEPAEKEK